uniref:Reverse transcriptase domain-containing protein n=1 Tax=Fagus sylvatica TaxID=28930 RepID=A0A2N9EKG6_FAGSY
MDAKTFRLGFDGGLYSLPLEIEHFDMLPDPGYGPLPLILTRFYGTQSPICCEPLNRIDPLSFTKFTSTYKGDVKALEEMMSKWVEGSKWVEALNAINTAGGVLFMWDKRVLEKIDSAVDRFSVSCHWKGVEDGFKWSGTRVYGPTLDSERIAFWYELTTISNRWTSPWCVFGDFNAIRYPREHWGHTSFNQSVVDFSDFIDGSNLIDLPLEGGLFTWSSGAENPSMSRIDRFLASPDSEEHYPDVNGIQNEEKSELKEKVVEFYSTLYQESKDWRPKVVDLPFKTIGEEALRVLERPFVQEEILQVLKDLQSDKALGPDGQFEKSITATFLDLIPKKHNALNIKDFYPISLIGCRMGFGLKWQKWIRACISMCLASDTILFCDNDPEKLVHIRLVLTCFEAVTGLKVNMSKSEMVPIGEVSNLPVLADILCCKIGSLPISYLGMPLGSHYKSTAVWNPIIEKMERRLAGSQRLYLSKGGRPSLLKSTFSSLPTYFLSLLTILHHLVSWDMVCSPVMDGGLGVQKLVDFNKTLLGGWCTDPVHGPRGCGLWKSVMGGWNQFIQHVGLRVGDGSRTRLWHDCWCGEIPLKEVLPTLFECAANCVAVVASILSRQNGGVEWNITFIQNFNDWEIDGVSTFLHLLYSHSPVSMDNDVLWWRLKKNGLFDIHSFYHAIRNSPRWVLPNRVINLLDGWWNLFGRQSSDIWNLVHLCLMWTIWRERNSRTFEDKEKS